MKFEDVNVNNATSLGEAINKQKRIENSKQFLIDLSRLPSRGKFYPEGITMSGRILKPSMLNKLSLMTLDNMDEVCNEVLSQSIIGLDYREIAVGDKWYLIYLLRDESYKHRPYEIESVCKSCGTKTVHNYTIDNLEVKYLSDTFERVITLEESGDSIVIDFPRIKNEFVAKNLKKDVLAQNYSDSIIDLSINIGTINGKEYTPIEKCEYIESLEPYDYSIFVSKLNEFSDYGITFEATFDCECGEKVNAVVPLTMDFFLPRYK